MQQNDSRAVRPRTGDKPSSAGEAGKRTSPADDRQRRGGPLSRTKAGGLGQQRFRIQAAILAGTSVLGGAILANGCSAEAEDNCFGCTGPGPSSSANAGGGGGGGGSSTSSGEGGILVLTDGGSDAAPDVFVNPCGTGCGPTELCDPAHVGLDDDCDGQVDETCDCQSGQAHKCFKGDPSYHGTEGCFDGTEKCTENGSWGPCIGGFHATSEDSCFLNNEICRPIQAVPFQNVNLKDGTGLFSGNALTESWTVACPPGVDPCPAVDGMNPADDYKPLQSGEYTVTYTKTVQGGEPEQCTYPLFVGARGLRVELQWEWPSTNTNFSTGDVDLHLHRPNNTQPWDIGGSANDCGYANCKVGSFSGGFGVDWFSGVAPPDPVNWYLDPDVNQNTCYFAPRGAGSDWQNLGLGCHNPRLDIDNTSCDTSSTDPDDTSFCAPENINVDFPPKNQWFRVGVHYYSGYSVAYDLHPTVNIYCEGALAAQLGPAGTFYAPPAPPTAVTFAPSDGQGGVSGNRFWMVADVVFSPEEGCSPASCIVQPLYADEVAKTPLLTSSTVAETTFGPDYPPLP